ncbi:uncharacterized protein LOC132026030 [Mustela nigripes]|uniref:uncharacterized protein LOC132026030 n=1 Tax=Mustela nigripes TaxID=77151 RepID=UPI0028152FA5|nr:uncharacterized protein LOC132026030 [Mustela nigripes]
MGGWKVWQGQAAGSSPSAMTPALRQHPHVRPVRRLKSALRGRHRTIAAGTWSPATRRWFRPRTEGCVRRLSGRPPLWPRADSGGCSALGVCHRVLRTHPPDSKLPRRMELGRRGSRKTRDPAGGPAPAVSAPGPFPVSAGFASSLHSDSPASLRQGCPSEHSTGQEAVGGCREPGARASLGVHGGRMESKQARAAAGGGVTWCRKLPGPPRVRRAPEFGVLLGSMCFPPRRLCCQDVFGDSSGCPSVLGQQGSVRMLLPGPGRGGRQLVLEDVLGRETHASPRLAAAKYGAGGEDGGLSQQAGRDAVCAAGGSCPMADTLRACGGPSTLQCRPGDGWGRVPATGSFLALLLMLPNPELVTTCGVGGEVGLLVSSIVLQTPFFWAIRPPKHGLGVFSWGLPG